MSHVQSDQITPPLHDASSAAGRTLHNPPTPPDIPGFELLRPIGRGSFGEVWLATDTATGARWAVKLLRRDGDSPRSKEAIELEGVREYRCVSQNHPHLLQILDVGDTAVCSYLVMELADDLHAPSEPPTGVGGRATVVPCQSEPPTPSGGPERVPCPDPGLPSGVLNDYRPKTLAAVLESSQGRRLPPAEALDIVRQVLEGLFVLHQQGLIHRDVKPANVLYVNGVVKLGDAGLVSAMEAARGHSGSIGYVPREERSDQSRDLFAVGRLLYTMVTGVHPTQFPSWPDDLVPDRSQGPDQRAAIKVMNKAAHPDAGKGFSNAGEALRAMDRCRRGPVWRQHPALSVGAILLVILLAAMGIRGMNSVVRPSAGERASAPPHLLACQKRANQMGGGEVELRFSDGTSILASPGGGKLTSAAVVDFGGDGHRLLVMGFDVDAPGEYAGAVAAFDPLEFQSQGAEPKPLFRTLICEDPPAAFEEETRGPCRADVLWAGDMDGKPGEELIVASSHYRGPAQLIVFGDGWKPLGKYWHFGWPLANPNMAPVSLEVEGRRCIAFPMYGNVRPEGISEERYHGAILILDSETLSRPAGLGGRNRFWSVNDWMNRSSESPPVGYGYTVPSQARSDNVALLRAVRRFAGARTDLLQLIFVNGIELDLDSNLNVLELRRSHPFPIDAPLPSPEEVWRRTWPPPSEPPTPSGGP